MNKIEKQGCTSTLSENGFTNPDKPNSNLASKLFKPKGSGKEPLTCRFSKKTLKAIQEIAEETGISKAEVVRKSVNRVLKRLRGRGR